MTSIQSLEDEGLIPGGVRGHGTFAAFCVDTVGGDYIQLFESTVGRSQWLGRREVRGPFHDHWGTPLEAL